MTLSITYKEYILNKLLKEYLYDGIIPTADQLEDDLETYQENHPDLSLPYSKYKDFTVARGDNSSIANLKEFTSTIADDASIVSSEVYNIANTSSRYYDRWSYEIKRLSNKSKLLEQRVDSLLLLANNTEGYFATVGDVFSDMNYIDTDNTTSLVNIYDQNITLNPGTANFGTISQINTTLMTDLDVAFYPLSGKTRSNTTYSEFNKDNSLLQIFKTEKTTWVGKVTSNIPGPLTCELKAKISNDGQEVSKISIECTTPNVTSRSTITAQYSLDGYTWYLLPTNEATKPLYSNISWTFPMVTLRWVKFIFYKSAPDQGNYEYVFAARSIKLFGNTYHEDRGNLFYSKSLYATNAEGNEVTFSKVQLKTCDNIPTDTDIFYYVSASRDNSTWTGWYAILPSQQTGIESPKVINFGGSSWKDNQSLTSSDDKLNSTYDYNQLITVFTNTDTVQYKFKNSKFAAVNTRINVSTGDDPDPVSNSIVVWRNLRYRELYPNYPDSYLVRKTVRGWGKNGKVYSCYFEIFDSNGVFFDFGDKFCIIDGKSVSGIVKINSGVHKFQTSTDNWYDISDTYTDLGYELETEEVLKSIDPLYPHNHKLVIEGFPYQVGFKGEKIYKGTDISAEYYAVRTSLFDLENNINDYGYFAIRGVDADEINASLAIIVRYDSNSSDFSNELFYVKWRGGNSDSSMYKYIKLKAELKTSNTEITPSISAYQIKLGV